MSLRDITDNALEVQIEVLERRLERNPERSLHSDRASLDACYRESDRRAGVRDSAYNLILPTGAPA